MACSEVKRRVLANHAFGSPLDYARRVGRFGSILLVGLAACASSVPRTIPRVVDGAVEEGPAVSPYAYEWFIEGERQATRGRHGEAAMAFESATAAPIADLLLIMRLAEEYELSGASRRADRILSLARRYYPDSARVSLTEGFVLRNRGEFQEALAAFWRAARELPGWEDPVVATAETLAARGHFHRATAVLLEFLETAAPNAARSTMATLVALTRRHADAETLERALAYDAGSTATTRAREAATLALAAGRPALASRVLEEALGRGENVHQWLQALVRSGERRRAAAFVASPEAARTITVEERAAFLLRVEEHARVLELLAAAERSPTVQNIQGSALLGRGEIIQAAQTLANVPFGSAPFESSRLALADCSISRARGGSAAETLSMTPHDSLRVRRKLADIYLAHGDVRAGLRLFDAREPAERTALASVFERAGRFEEASAYYAAVEVTASSPPRLRARASAEQLVSRGLRTSAITILEHWVSFAPDDLYSRVRLVELLQAESRLDEAETRARETLPLVDDPNLRTRLITLLREREPVP